MSWDMFNCDIVLHNLEIFFNEHYYNHLGVVLFNTHLTSLYPD